MKKVLLVGFCLVMFSCNSPKDNGDHFTVTRIEAGKDGQNLHLKDKEGDEYITVISIPNGNFVEVVEGDKVKLEIAEVLDTNPVMLISKSVKVIPTE